MKKIAYLGLFVFVMAISVIGCRENKSPGEKIEDGIEEVGDGIEDGAEDVIDEIDDATDGNE